MNFNVFVLFLVAVSFLCDVVGVPVQFPEEGKSVGEARTLFEEEPKFHHHKKKKRKKKKKGCSHHHHFRSADPNDDPEGRFFFLTGINYYNTDIYLSNGYRPGKPGGNYNSQGSGDPCGGGSYGSGPIGTVIGGLGGLGSLLVGGNGGGGGGSSSSSSSSSSSGSNGGDNGNGDSSGEDYDYSDGAGDNTSGNSGRPSNFVGQGISSLGSFAGSAPGTVSNIIGTIGSGIRPVFERPERYFNYYVVRPINRSLRQLVNWF